MFFQNAYEGRNRWWRWLLTIFGTMLVWLIGQVPLLLFINVEAMRLGVTIDDFHAFMLHADMRRNLFLLLNLVPFVLGLVTLRFFITRLHKKAFLSVLTGRLRFDWSRAALGFAVWFILISFAVLAILPAVSYSYQFNPAAFWPLLAVALLLIPIQTTAEEVFFRGYLTQGLSLLLKNKLATLIVVAVMFAAAHVGNPEFQADYAKGALGYLALSFLLGFVATMDDGIELPCGIHAANNIFAAAILSSRDGTFTTDSLFVSTVSDLMYGSPYVDISLCVIAFFIFYYIFGWRVATLFAPTRPAPRADREESGEQAAAVTVGNS